MEPQNTIGLAHLSRLAFDGIDLTPLRRALIRDCLHGEDAPSRLMDLSIIDQIHGHTELGLYWQGKALEAQRSFRTVHEGHARKSLLVIAQSGQMGRNTPVEFLLEQSGFQVVTFYPGVTDKVLDELPVCDVAFCAAPMDAEDSDQFRKRVRAFKQDVPVLNFPDDRIDLDRDRLGALFIDQPGLRFAATVRATRCALRDLVHSNVPPEGIESFPILVRPIGSHAGEGLRKCDSAAELGLYLADRTETEFFLSEYIDYASPTDRLFRKYRIIFVEGEPYPCHMAIADHWDIWYLNAGMDRSAPKRAEEALFMDQFDSGFAARHRSSLRILAERIDLDYFGIDCAEDAEGNLVVFEADNTLIVHDMDPATVFPYKSAHMQRIFAAFERMLLSRCRPSRPAN
ncbi:MAG: hypothetical protein GJ676_21785 [Rhodobacteraceae bacterium]|nr:hypothetical protein [Paracoccaceae bacterium]